MLDINFEVQTEAVPEIELARKFRFSPAQLKEIEGVIEAHSDEFKTAWQQFFSR